MTFLAWCSILLLWFTWFWLTWELDFSYPIWTCENVYVFRRSREGVGLEKAMAPHFSTLAWKIPWTEEPGRLQSMGLLRVGHDWVTSLSLFTFMHWRRTCQPTPVFLPGESQGLGSLVGCRLWGRTELDMTEATWQQQGVGWFLSLENIQDPLSILHSVTFESDLSNSFRAWLGSRHHFLSVLGLSVSC